MAGLTPLLTVPQVAEILGVTRATIYVYVENGTLRAVRIGGVLRFRPDDVQALIDRSTTPTGEAP
jgi:excisionase family DNA binding protein